MSNTTTTTAQDNDAQQLWQAATRICAEIGGQPVQWQRGDAAPTVYITDCPAWTRRASALLRVARPRALIAVDSTHTSLSGFAVVLSEPPPPHQLLPRLLTVALVVLVLLGGSALAHHQLAGAPPLLGAPPSWLASFVAAGGDASCAAYGAAGAAGAAY